MGKALAVIGSMVTADAVAEVPGTRMDTLDDGQAAIAYDCENEGANSITALIRGSIDGENWYDLVAMDEDGVAHAAAEVAIAAAASAVFVLTPLLNNGVGAAMRFFSLWARSTVAATPGEAVVTGYAK